MDDRTLFAFVSDPKASEWSEVDPNERPKVDRLVNPFEEKALLAVLVDFARTSERSRPIQDLFALYGARDSLRFDESLGTFDRMVGNAQRASETAPFPSARLQQEMSVPGFSLSSDFVPNSMIQPLIDSVLAEGHLEGFSLQSIASKARNGRISVEATDIPFLARTFALMGFGGGTLNWKMSKWGQDGEIYSIDISEFEFVLRLDSDRSIAHSLLSYGQKRLLSFMYYLDCETQIVIADELVNGLHHEWIKFALESIGDRQALLSSQNPLLMDFLHFDTPEDVSRTFIMTEVEESGRWFWRNLNLDEVASFFSAYQVGFQHVSEILRAKGLW